MATLVSDVINLAFIELGVIQPGETLPTAIQTSAFLTFQQMWSGWSAEQVMNYIVYHQAFTLTSGTAAYTVGTAGTLVATARPVRITGWEGVSGAFKAGGRTVSFEALHEATKNGTGKTSALPEMVAADQAFPAINIQIEPTPNATSTLILDYYAALPSWTAVTDTLALPDGWEQALVFNLAMALAPSYARVGGIPQTLAANAQNSKAQIVAKNAAILGLQQAAQ